MSKMMDNLARLLEEESKASPAQRPPLFVVRDSIAPSARSSGGRLDRRRLLALSAAAFVLVAGLGIGLWREFSGARPAPQAQQPVDSAILENGRGVELLRSGQFAEAEKLLRDLLARKPALRAARLNHGYALKALGKAAEAEKEYAAVLKLHPGDAVALNNLGTLYLGANRLSEAEAALRRASEGDPAYSDALMNLAAVFEAERDWVQAAATYDRLLQASGENAIEPRLRERVRRVRSLAAAASGPKEKF